MSIELKSILAEGRPVSKARLRDYLGRRAAPAISAEHFGVVATVGAAPIPDKAVQRANHDGIMGALREASRQGGGEVVLPNGYIFVDDTIEIGNDTMPDPDPSEIGRKIIPLNLRGAGREATKLVNMHPTHPLIRIFSSRRARSLPELPVRLREMSLLGRGRLTTGNLVEIYGGVENMLDDILLEGTAGRAIHVSRSERNIFRDVITFKCRQSLIMHDACNESYLFNFQPLASGYTEDPLLQDDGVRSWSVNSDGGHRATHEGNVRQETRAGVQIERTQNVRWIGGSCKSMHFLAGVKCRVVENVQIDHIYFEGFMRSNPSVNPAVIFGGAMERTRLAQPIGATSDRIEVEDASWFPTQFSTDRIFGSIGESRQVFFAIYDPDDVTQFEVINAPGFVGDTLHVKERGADATRFRLAEAPARSWPAGSVLTEMAFGVGDLTLHGNHLEAFQSFVTYPGLTLQEDARKGWTNGQVVVGFTADDFFSAPNFRKDDIPGVCHLECTGHNRVRHDRDLPQDTHLVQGHGRASVFISPESRRGGLRAASAWADDREHWLQIVESLTTVDPVRTSDPGGIVNVRRDVTFARDRAVDINLATFRHLFTAPGGAVIDCRLYSVDDFDNHGSQGRDFVAAFVLDYSRGRQPAVSVRYLRGSPDLTPHLRLRRGRSGRGVDLGLIASPAYRRPEIRLRFDATSICGFIWELEGEFDRTEGLFALTADNAVTLNALAPGSNQANPAGPAGGGELFIEDGALKYRGPAGTVTTIAPA